MDYTWFDWLTPAEIAADGVAKLKQRAAERAAREHLAVRRLVVVRADPAGFPYLAERGSVGGGLLFRIDIEADDLVLQPVDTTEDHEVLERLAELYWHDLSEYEPMAFDCSGRFFIGVVKPDPQHAKVAYLAYNGLALAGFVVIKRDEDRHWIDQFFVLRAHRRSGLGTRIAYRVLDQHSGPWSLSVIKSNDAALAFWRDQITRAAASAERAGQRRVRIDFDWISGPSSAGRSVPGGRVIR